ncbi:MAG TPA: porin family protein [Flavipsychrobacter sp.]|nr:porin family protein [Flavipsychrobacter sp.]
MSPLRWCLVALLCLSFPALAQDDEDDAAYLPDTLQLGTFDNPFVAGLIVGGNTGSIRHDFYQGFHNIGYTAGITVYIRLTPNFWVNSEILYTKRGCTGVRNAESVYWGTYIEKYQLRLSYAELPVLFHIFQNKYPWCHISFGASYSRYLNSRENLYTSPDALNVNQELFYFNKNNFDYIIGGALHINKKLYLNIRYQSSIVPIRDAYRVHPSVGAGDQYATTCSLHLMYLFRNLSR